MAQPNFTIPALVKHMTIAIYRKGKITAKSRADLFKQCLMIAKTQCQRYGFVVFAGNGLDEPIGLTPKGRKREMHHQTHGRATIGLFDTLYDQFDIDGSKAAAAQKAQEQAATGVAKTQETGTGSIPKKDQLP